MLEQQMPDTTTQQPTDPQTMTQLEGIRQKVFMDGIFPSKTQAANPWSSIPNNSGPEWPEASPL